jgi:hypothetical protein
MRCCMTYMQSFSELNVDQTRIDGLKYRNTCLPHACATAKLYTLDRLAPGDMTYSLSCDSPFLVSKVPHNDYIHIYIQIHMCIYMNAYIRMYVYDMYVLYIMYVLVCVCVCVYVCVCIYIYIYIYISSFYYFIECPVNCHNIASS